MHTHTHICIYITLLIDFRYYLGHFTVWSKQRSRQIFATPNKRNDQVKNDFSVWEPNPTWSSSATAKSCGSVNLAVLDTTSGNRGTEAPSSASCMAGGIGSAVGAQIFPLAGHSVLCITVIQTHNLPSAKLNKRTWQLTGVTFPGGFFSVSSVIAFYLVSSSRADTLYSN